MHFGERLRERRLSAGYSWGRKFAIAYNEWRTERGMPPVGIPTVLGWERWGNPTVEQMGPLLDFLGVVDPAERLAMMESRRVRVRS